MAKTVVRGEKLLVFEVNCETLAMATKLVGIAEMSEEAFESTNYNLFLEFALHSRHRHENNV